MSETTRIVIGLDLGDKTSRGFVRFGEKREESEFVIRTTKGALRREFSRYSKARVAFETGTHSPWVSRELEALGHEVLVANARQVALIHRSLTKSDRADARCLCMLADCDPKLLAPIKHRSEERQADLAVARSRTQLIEVRTRLVNHVRGMVKSWGERLPSCSTPAFGNRVKDLIPAPLKPALEGILALLTDLNETIKAYDRQMEQLCTKYPECERLQQVVGVGPVTAITFLLTIEDPMRFKTNRSVGGYFGLVPREHQSGARAPELSITHAGDSAVRKLLVQSAHYILGRFGPDTDLRRWGVVLASRGGKNAKKRATVAVARKLAVLLLSLWKSGLPYEPLRQAERKRVPA